MSMGTMVMNEIEKASIGLSGKFVPTNLYNLINNILKFKSSTFQFSFNIGTNFPDNPIYNNYDRNIAVNHLLPPITLMFSFANYD